MADKRNVFLIGAGILAAVLAFFLIPDPGSPGAIAARTGIVSPLDRSVWLDAGEVQALFERVAEKHMPAVVQLQLIQRDERPFGPDQLEDFFLPDAFRVRTGRRPEEQSIGAGVIIRSDGYIVTARHLLKNVDDVHVILHDGSRLRAERIGSDALTDVAVLKIEAVDLPALEPAPEAPVRTGQWVISIGSPLSNTFRNSVTLGVVSALSTTRDSLNGALYTDAALNPGNSGGPLIDARGRMIGMAAVPYSISRGFTGIGRAIPASVVAHVAAQLIARGRVERARLGVQYGPVTADVAAPEGAARIVRVEPGSAAEAAGLQPGDVVLAVDGARLDSHLDLSELVAAGRPGDVVTLTIQRGGDAIDMPVRLQEDRNTPASGPDDDPQEKLMREMGFTVDDVTPELVRDMEVPIEEGVVVLYVNPSSTSYREGDLRGGMVIVEMADQKIRNQHDFMRVYNEIPSGVTFLVVVYRPLMRGALLTALTKP